MTNEVQNLSGRLLSFVNIGDMGLLLHSQLATFQMTLKF